ncbi:TonB-linked SusC/RagA family outer membrane protein [Chitinophaga ginsengisoli]|uniref:TonB-linked SusC/RagA family outer membrane protein n=2 Tax=Chitinophaga ginsengisoli TaxID=363837 RepID=A0A2P8GLP5_9BACT|nr:TonB-linked SusC/RagA family outer membrane protein [Chitinophaga ginsengisoli]
MKNIVPGKGMPIPFSKIVMIMKLIIPLILVAVLHVSGSTYAQKVTISKKKAALTDIFKAISEQTGREFLASPTLLANTHPIDINVKDQEISEFLPALLARQGLVYSILNNVIVITRDPKSYLPVTVTAADPPKIVKGWVVDPSGTRLPGATVMLKGSRKGTMTDASGYFELKVEDGAENAELTISYTGYIVKTATVSLKTPTFIYLKPSTNELDQVQVIAYGTTTKRFNTGNVATVTAADIAKNPVSNPLLALSGRVSGLVINQTTGMPGGAVTVQLRGRNSIASGNDILYIIDGVPFKGGTSGSVNSALAQGNLLDLVNPADIESIDVLKDADATSIYGSRGANGVILITTKKGKPGRTQVNLTAYTGISKITRMPEYMNLQQYLQMRHEAFANDNAKPGFLDYDVNGTWDTTRYTNWQKLILGGNAHTSDVQGTITGGTDNVQYLVGGGYHRETPIMPTDGALKKGSAHFSISGTSNDRKLSINAGGIYVSNTNNITPVDPTFNIRLLAPDAPKIYNPDGTLNWENGTFDNPYAALLQPYLGRSNHLNGNVTIGYKIIKGMNVKVAAGYENVAQNEYVGNPLSISNPYKSAGRQATARYRNANYGSWNVEPQVTYNFGLGKGNFETLLGATFRHEQNENLTQSGVGYASDALLRNPQAAATITVEDFGNNENKYTATFGRIKYNFANKYFLNLNGRYDGSSRFGPDSRFHFFWSAGGGWIFTEEKAVKELLPFMSFGKLRGSYGTTGNDNIGDYAFLDLYKSLGFSYQGDKGLQPQALFNPDLAWEATRKIEGAIDLGFLHDRILVTASYYTNRSNNQLLAYQLSAVTGFSSIQRNLPAVVQNTGWEFELRTTNIKDKNFEWTSFLNISLPRNKLTKYPGLSPDDPNFIIGKPLGITRVYQYAGVDPQTGTYRFIDSKDKSVAAPDQKIAFIDPTVKYFGGFQNSLRYKNWSLDLLFQFEQHVVKNPLLNGIFPPGFMGNQLVDVALDRWQKPGDVKDIPKYSQNIFGYLPWALYARSSTLAYSDAAFLRLKNVSFSYQLPSKWLQKIHLQQVALFAQGQNLLTFTKKEFRDFDPESGGLNLSPMKTFTGGIKVNL